MYRDRNLHPLSHSHQRDLGLSVLIQRELAADPGPANVAHQAVRVLDHYDMEIREHFLVEEQVLFPALQALPELADLIRELLVEHAQLAMLIATITAMPSRDTLVQFCQLLTSHIRKEEERLFPRVQDRLTQKDMDRLGMQLAGKPPIASA
mgnify:CR=1 FL=1